MVGIGEGNWRVRIRSIKRIKSNFREIVNLILSSLERDILVERIRSTLKEIREDIENGKIALEKFEILKQLTRDPADYKDAKLQPHAVVALRLNDSKKFHFRHGDVVKYIICQVNRSYFYLN